MKTLRNLKRAFVYLILFSFALTLLRTAAVRSTDEMQNVLSKDYAGISIRISATNETVPDGNMTVDLWVNCTATGVEMGCLELGIYGFRSGQAKTLLNATSVLTNTSLLFTNTTEYVYDVLVPSDVWGVVQGELHVEYLVVDQAIVRDESFTMTFVRNVYWEELERQFQALNDTYQLLNSTYWSLNDTYALLNQTYWELQQNYTSLQGVTNELDGTRRVVAILVVTTVFFIATTAYLVIRKPRQYW